MKKVFTAEELRELLTHITAIAELVHESNTKVAKDVNMPDEFTSYMNSKILSAPEDLKCECPDCNPEGAETQ